MPEPDEKKEDGGYDIIRRWSTGEALPDEDVRKAFERYIADGRPLVDFFMLGVANRRVQGIVKMFQQIQIVEDRLFTEGKIDGADVDELIKILALLHKTVDSNLEFVKQFGTGKVLPRVTEEGEAPDPYSEFDSMSPESKQKLITIIGELNERMKKDVDKDSET